MASRLPSVVLLLACACGGSGAAPPPTPGPPPEPEVARPPWALLVERLSAAGTRSFLTMSPDRTFVAPLAGIPGDVLRVVPSPDGRTLALLRAQDGLVHLWLADRSGASLRPLVAGERTVGGVTWSPDGRRLAFHASSTTESDDIWVIGADGTGAVDLTPDPLPGVWYDREPAWSPDGSRIAFSSNRSGTRRVWSMGADGAEPRQVVPQEVVSSEVEPSWSPDGSLLAFSMVTPGGTGVGVARPDGSDLRLLAGPVEATEPVWLPDGRIAFADRRTVDFEIHLLDPATGETRNLTHHPDHDLRASVLRHVPPAPWRGLSSPWRLEASRIGPFVVASDLDGDGQVDVGTLAAAAPEIGIFRGDGAGHLQALGSLDVAGEAVELAVGRVTLDAHPDLVLLERSALVVHRGGPGGPGVAETTGLLGEGRGMALADLDRDGRDDVAVAFERPGSGFHLGVYRASGVDGILFNLDLATDFTGVGRLCAGDVTGDGKVDVVALTGSPSSPVLLLAGRGDVTLDAPLVAATGLAVDAASVPACADLDGDARADLLVLRPGPGDAVAVLPAAGSGFGPARGLGVGARALVAGDLDRDGDVDLVAAPWTGRSLLFLRNLGDGRFAAPVEVPLEGTPVGLVLADLDGDAWPDVVVTEAEGSVAVLRNLGGG